MNKYTANAAIDLPAGAVLELNKEQAAARSHAVSRKGKTGNVYVTNLPVQFKRGEVFGYEGELPKAMADDLSAEAKAGNAEPVSAEKPASEA